VLTIRFLTELALLALLVVVGLNASAGLPVRIAIAVLGPVAAAVLWGIALSPRARWQPPDPWRLGIEIILFAGVAAAWSAEGSIAGAVIFAVVAIGTAVAVRVYPAATGGTLGP
jgi:hypothetical protein